MMLASDTRGTDGRPASIRPWLDAAEVPELMLETKDAQLWTTDRRLLVVSGTYLRLAVAYPDLRRVAFDIEPQQGTIVIVPRDSLLEAQVLWIGPEALRRAGRILARIGERMGGAA